MNRFDSYQRGIRTAVVAVVAGTALVVSSCSDPLGLRTQYATADQPFTVYALSDADLAAPTGMDFVTRTVVRADGQFAFDIAFDINASRLAVILPANQVGTPVGGAPLVGLLRSTSAYDAVTAAPTGGYVFDSTMAVTPGETIVIQAQVVTCTAYYTPYIFAKIRVDSVNAADHSIHGHTLINTNCGSRQLTPGIPTF